MTSKHEQGIAAAAKAISPNPKHWEGFKSLVSTVVEAYLSTVLDGTELAEVIEEHQLGTTWGDDGITFVGCGCGEWFGKELEDGWERARQHQARAVRELIEKKMLGD